MYSNLFYIDFNSKQPVIMYFNIKSKLILLLFLFGAFKSVFSQSFDGTNLSSSKPFFDKIPYVFEGSENYYITIKTDSTIIRQLVPEPLNPLKSDELTVIFARHKLISPIKMDYNEVYFIIPAGYGFAFGGFIPVLYLDKIEAITPAREIWGYNKVGGKFEFIENDSIVSITVSQLDSLIMKATFILGKPFIPEREPPSGPAFNIKYIPSAIENAPPDVHQIITSKLADRKTHRMRTGTAQLEFFTSYFNPVDKIPILEVIRAGYFSNSFSMVYGDVLYDYLNDSN